SAKAASGAPSPTRTFVTRIGMTNSVLTILTVPPSVERRRAIRGGATIVGLEELLHGVLVRSPELKGSSNAPPILSRIVAGRPGRRGRSTCISHAELGRAADGAEPGNGGSEAARKAGCAVLVGSR